MKVIETDIQMHIYKDEVEIYIGCYFLTSINVDEISKEALEELDYIITNNRGE